MPAAPAGHLLLVADDLITPSRVREGARPLGYQVAVAATETTAREMARATPPPAAILVNLTARRYDPAAVIRDLKAREETRRLPILAFAGHMEQEKHESARAAGANLVAANSSVALHLPVLLSRLLSDPTISDSPNPIFTEAVPDAP
jgi:CheY-like chemotaxis protein